ncbi:MAG: N-acetylneuraminate synthase [Tissierellales bacterium]|nr:N-acetylneuraminate synthase [Tissierellales bacterium]
MKDKVIIIAEAGVNHNGDIKLAKELVYRAKMAGADMIKFQTYKTEELTTIQADLAEYQKKTDTNVRTQYELLKSLELSYDDFSYLKKYSEELGIKFISTAFDFDSIEFLDSIGLETWKIPSGEITNLPYLIKIARLNRSIILSTGMCTLDEVENALTTLKDNGAKDITIMHCTTEYPTPFSDVNLKAMVYLKDIFKTKVGYSDHTRGIEVPIAAVALGASIIEKHFTLDRNMEGPDHISSLEPDEFKCMVESIRNIELALGNSIKKPTETELQNRNIARKSIVAKKFIKKGEVFTEENITVKRPGNGISPMHWFDVLGKVASRDFKEDELIEI